MTFVKLDKTADLKYITNDKSKNKIEPEIRDSWITGSTEKTAKWWTCLTDSAIGGWNGEKVAIP